MGPTGTFFIVIIAMTMVAFIVATWMKTRATHGHVGSQPDAASLRHIELLSAENEGLKGKISRLEERISVLERIATDPAARTAREIDDLR